MEDTGTRQTLGILCSPRRRVALSPRRYLGAGSWALRQGHLQVQALALA